MILKESELDDEDIIYPILGKPYKEPGKLLTATGSSMFFVREATDPEGNPLPLKREEMKGIFQKYEKGLMLYLNKSNYQNAILISYDSVKRISLIQYLEERKVPSELFLKIFFAIPNNPISRFMYRMYRYKTRETLLEIETNYFKAKLATSYSSFSTSEKYFSSLDCADRFQVVEQPTKSS